jgi:TIR domain
MAGVFISYRREDTPAHAGRLYERLASRYGKRRVFRDLDAIPIAKDFRERINEAISSCDALIAVIVRDWLTLSDSSGQPKLHNPRDWLTVEIATALRMNKVVIPVLVENADMPSEDALPDPLKPVAYIHALKTSEQD